MSSMESRCSWAFEANETTKNKKTLYTFIDGIDNLNLLGEGWRSFSQFNMLISHDALFLQS